LRLLLLVVIGFAAFAAPRTSPDWQQLSPEILDHYQSLIRLDTTSPPGNETLAANYLKKVLERAGIPSKIFTLEPDRGNLIARLKGNGSKRPLLIMAHTDVVGVQRDKWSVDPFAAVEKNGYIYGRGTNDNKDKLVACLAVILQLKRLNIALDRDVIFLAEAGEEGTTRVGIDFMVAQHWPEIEAEYALTEGGGGILRNGKPTYLGISTTEKVPRTVRLVATGTAGHGSIPRPDNAVVKLATAVSRVAEWQPPMRLNDTTRAYFERLATISSPEDAVRYKQIVDRTKARAIEAHFSRHELMHYSMLRTSVVPTIMKAGFRSNVIPSQAEATLDIRALPDEDMPKLYSELTRVIGDPSVEVVPPTSGRPVAPPSRLDTEMFRALEAACQKVYPGAITLPTMLTGATDNAQLRAKGVQAYGFGPMTDEQDRLAHGAHSDDERLAVDALYKEVQFLWEAVIRVAAKN
jgi:acetylornithine deacetylase/succinyl-diaminopimelate desuccinylase-like protein